MNFDWKDAALHGIYIHTTEHDGAPAYGVLTTDGQESLYRTLDAARRDAVTQLETLIRNQRDAEAVAEEWQKHRHTVEEAQRLADRINHHLPDGCTVETDGYNWTGAGRYSTAPQPLPAIADALAVWRAERARRHLETELEGRLALEGSIMRPAGVHPDAGWLDTVMEWWRPARIAIPETGAKEWSVDNGRVCVGTMTRRAIARSYGLAIPADMSAVGGDAGLDEARGYLQAAMGEIAPR